MTPMTKLKNNRTLLLFLLGGGILLILMSITLIKQNAERNILEERHESLIAELNTLERDIAVAQAELDEKTMDSIKKTTGIDPKLVATDAVEAKTYFKPAFNWQNGDEYEKARQLYIDYLGKDNSFTKTYLPPDTKIETNDGKVGFIDFKGMKATMDDLFVVPVKVKGDSIRYVGIVRYFMHKDKSDLANPDALMSSQAIVDFTVTGNNDSDGRRLIEVSARPGFSSVKGDE